MLRIGSAAVLLAIVLVTLWLLPPWATAVLAALAAALAAGELARMAEAAGAGVPSGLVAVGAATIVLALLFDATGSSSAGLLVTIVPVLVIGSGLMTLALGPPQPQVLGRAAIMTFAPLYAGLPLGAIAWVQSALGPAATTWLLAVVAVSDTAQYYTGRAFGRTKLAPVVSPSKTREGAVGGVIVAAVAGAALGIVCLPGRPPLVSGGIALALAAFGIAGDLFESLLKRSVGFKDSSALIPGHGGILDRIDSHLFAAPVFFLLVRWLP